MGWYLFMWGLFTAYMYLGTLNKNRALQFVFGSLTLLFFLLAIADWLGNATLTKIAGWEGIVCGMSAIYLAAADVLNETYETTILPIGPTPDVKIRRDRIRMKDLPPLEPTVPHPHDADD